VSFPTHLAIQHGEAAMKSLIGTVLVAAFAFSVPLLSQEQRHDGNWWIKDSKKDPDSELHQLLYVNGFIEGMDSGLASLESDIAVKHYKEKNNQCVAEAVEAYKKESKYTDNVTTGQVWDGLNDFYSDYRNRSISVSNAVDLVLRQIKGENVDGLILANRQNAK
jgi:hypothetical protein